MNRTNPNRPPGTIPGWIRWPQASWLALLAITCLAEPARAAEDKIVRAAAPSQALPAAVEHFEKKVRPLLAAQCWKCHGPAKAKGGLRLDTVQGLARGGASGPVVRPGRPADSLLLAAVRHDGELKMPPAARLKDQEIAALAAWIKDGASGRPATNPARQPWRQPSSLRSKGPSGPFSRSRTLLRPSSRTGTGAGRPSMRLSWRGWRRRSRRRRLQPTSAP